MDSIKDENGMDLTEAVYIKKNILLYWQEYTEELYIYKKIFTMLIITMVWSLI